MEVVVVVSLQTALVFPSWVAIPVGRIVVSWEILQFLRCCYHIRMMMMMKNMTSSNYYYLFDFDFLLVEYEGTNNLLNLVFKQLTA